ncbi:hypothetical protein DCAR_0312379 [Daucus carota subsp. sativus]|uniref:Cyclin-dependent kinase inhibitor n=1 Tax=Daucus carota subsp. sativus TaxID=79200 RepID=A0A166AZE5_DAUCS|nr:PREDICTED: cyclin-dependent kinase inhibitor 7-like isoform X1 [Daucus carota subsp. sativus]WOG93098.1 hypothetical protein DCAR_0312379 [Daucus carota subsp. sativus]
MDASKVRVRAEALDMSEDRPGKLKRRKVGSGELAMSSSLTHELNNIRKNSTASDSLGDGIAANNESLYPNFGSHGGASCCSSNGSDKASFDTFDSTDMVERGGTEASSSTKYNSSERGEETTLKLKARETPLQRESTFKTSFQRLVTTEKFMPSEAQLEEFFAVAERGLRNQFADKYNYDISKDEPMVGRYEWLLLKP